LSKQKSTVKKQKDRAVQKSNEVEIRLENEIQSGQRRIEEAVETTRNQLTLEFESNIEEFVSWSTFLV